MEGFRVMTDAEVRPGFTLADGSIVDHVETLPDGRRRAFLEGKPPRLLPPELLARPGEVVR